MVKVWWQAEWPTKKVHTLIPGIYGYIMLYGKKNFVDIIKFADFKVGKLSNVIWIVEADHTGP